MGYKLETVPGARQDNTTALRDSLAVADCDGAMGMRSCAVRTYRMIMCCGRSTILPSSFIRYARSRVLYAKKSYE